MAKALPRAGRAPRTPGHQRPPLTPGKISGSAQSRRDRARPERNTTGGSAPQPQGGAGS